MVDGRLQRALAIYAKGNQIKRVDGSTYKVKSQSGNGWHLVTKKGEEWSCECPDHTYRQVACMHIQSTLFSLTLRDSIITSPDTIPRSEETEPNECTYCHSSRIVKRAIRRNLRGLTQRYWCKACNRRFVVDLGFSRMKASPQVITASLDLFFKGVSLRKITDHVKQFYNLKVNCSTILRWIQRYTELMEGYASDLVPKVSEKWHADETVENVNGKNRWLWNLMDSESRFLIASRLTKARTDRDARNLFLDGLDRAKKAPTTIVTDGLVSYANAYDETLRYKGTKHIRKPRFIDLANNNRIERLHSSMRERTKVMRGFDTDSTANETMQGYRLYYNFIRPHMALDGQTPAQAANLELGLGRNRWKSMITQSTENGRRPPKETENKAKYRKRAAIGVVRRYKKGKASLTWLQGMIAYLRNKKGLTEHEIKQVLRYMDAGNLSHLLSTFF
ncbi:MAG: IS6 family transposase [Candidatus Bathyarchaeia archaeon]